MSCTKLKLTSDQIKKLEKIHRSPSKAVQAELNGPTPINVGDRQDLTKLIDDIPYSESTGRRSASQKKLDDYIDRCDKMKSILMSKRRFSPDLLAAIGILEVLMDIAMTTEESEVSRKKALLRSVARYRLESLPSKIFPTEYHTPAMWKD
jgi:hypothetical protein